ncbi:PH domain-containing protein [Streptomyces sp. G-5]|uniref:PH domain-containing protein n=1 Tax=Streptomyces sp. G-5 TaxID=2977231 RepID=UPI0021D2043F|nr:PH domain-containing protein [Streptomyces sp. G-5]MCU4749497.1 PH domain-containing protein [Streptomyces sp. G-5]
MDEIEYRHSHRRQWLLTGVALAALAVSILVPLFWGLSTGDHDERLLLAGLMSAPICAASALFFIDRALSRTVVNTEGIHVKRPARRRFYPWREIASIASLEPSHSQVTLVLTDGSLLTLPAPAKSADRADASFERGVAELRRHLKTNTRSRR